MDSEGLLLLTDDGVLARKLTHPATALPRTYRVRVGGRIELHTLQRLRTGGGSIGRNEASKPWDVTVEAESRGHTWLTVTLHSGRWREVRRTLAACGHPVRRLIRTRFGPLALGALPAGQWRNLHADEIVRLKNT